MAKTDTAPVKAQTEIGPTTFVEGGEIIQHGPNDPETKEAYAAGHPAVSTLRHGSASRTEDAGNGDDAADSDNPNARSPLAEPGADATADAKKPARGRAAKAVKPAKAGAAKTKGRKR
jgi:hypothetical protein